MNVFHNVTLRSLRKNRTRTAVTVIGIILSAAMICAVTTFADSIIGYALESQIYATGNWHGRALGRDYKTYETVRDSDQIEAAAYFQELGYAAAEECENEFKPYIYLLGAAQNDDGTLPVHISDGRFPRSSDEILLPNHLYDNGGVKYNIGDTLTLSLGRRVLDGDVLTQESPCYVDKDGESVFSGETLEVRESRTYTVVGFYERPDWQIEEYSAPGYTALTLADKEPSPEYGYDVYFRMKHPKDVYSFMAQNALGTDTNENLLMFTGTFRFDSFNVMLYSLAAIVIGLIMFGSVALIYNAFSISVSERTKQFGLLSSVGATRKQLRRTVLFEAFVVSLIGIPIGIAAGVGGIGVTLLLIGDKFHSLGFGNMAMKLSVSAVSIAVAAAVALVTVLISAWIPSRRAARVSAVEAIRQNADISDKSKAVKTSKLTYALFGLPGVLAGKHYKRSRKKYRATVLSLFMSIVLFVSASAFTEYLTEAVSGGFESVGYDLVYHANFDDFERITPKELLDRIKAAKSVTDGAYARELYGADVKISSEYLTEKGASFIRTNLVQGDDASLEFNMNISFVDDDSYRALLKAQGLSEDMFTDPSRPTALALDGITQFNVNAQRYETVNFYDRDEFEMDLSATKEISGYTLCETVRDENGNDVYRYIKNDTEYDDGEFIELTEAEAVNTTTLQVGKVITQKPNFIRDIRGIWLVYPISMSNAVIENFDTRANYGYYFTVCSSNHRESYESVRAVLRESGFTAEQLYDEAGEVESDRNVITIIRVFSYGFTVLISLIAAANVFNTISTNISLRRREFAMLRSVGMTSRGFNMMMNFECLLYGSKALLYGVPVSCGVTWLIYCSVISGYETNFRLPWAAIGIAALSVFLVVFVTMMYAMNKVKKDNPIDALKNENL